MRVRNIAALGIFAVAVIAAVGLGQAMQVRATVDFPFTVEGKMLPAGTYDLIRDDTASVFRVTDNGKNQAVAPVLTRIANMMPSMAALVFDVVGDNYVLAEVWVPGQDGYVIAVTKGVHKHKVVNAK
jgi:hypothetical protein